MGRAASTLAAFCWAAVPAQALEIPGEVPDPEAGNIYNQYESISTGGTVRNADFVFADSAITAIGYELNDATGHLKQSTLISPRHALAARHFLPPNGATLRFVTATGTTVDRTVIDREAILNDEGESTDIAVVTLDAPITAADGIEPINVLNLESEAAHLAPDYRDLMVFGRRAQAANAEIANFSDVSDLDGRTTRCLVFHFVDATAADGTCNLQKGDSSGPVIINVDGQPTLSAINYAVLPLRGGFFNDQIIGQRNFCSHVGNADYLESIDATMAAQGYAATRQFPAATETSTAFTVSETIRAGYPTVIEADIAVIGQGAAKNVRTEVTADYDVTLGGPSFFADGENAVRRGTIDAGGSGVLSAHFTPSTAGLRTISFATQSDGSTMENASITYTVLPSYREEASHLADASLDADPDGDGLSNLEEYAYGGRYETADTTLPDSEFSIRPSIVRAPEGLSLQFIRRRDFALRGLDYVVKASSQLDVANFKNVDLSGAAAGIINDAFERVSVPLDATVDTQFLRVEVTLDEEPTEL